MEYNKIVVNPETNEPEVVPLTAEEITELLAEKAAAQADFDAMAAIEAERQADLIELASDKVTAALTQIATDEAFRKADETAVDTDITGLTAQTAVQVLGRVLAREKRALNREQRTLVRQKTIIKVLRWLISQSALIL